MGQVTSQVFQKTCGFRNHMAVAELLEIPPLEMVKISCCMSKLRTSTGWKHMKDFKERQNDLESRHIF